MERGVSTDVQVTTRHSFEDETMRTSDTVSCKLGADSLVHDQLLSFRSYALQNPSKIGVRFDPDMPQTIRLEFAKSNTKVSKPKQPAAAAATSHPALMHPLTGHLGSPFFPGGPELWHHPLAYSTAGELPGTLQHATLVHPALHPQVPAPMSLPHPTTLTSIHASLPHFLPSPALASPVGSPSSQPNIAVSNAQCSTLFVANLGQFVSEHELKDIFSSFPGFSRLRMHTKGGSPVAFVEYQDVRYAAQAMATLQGSFLLSSDRGAIRIEYAKSKMAEVGFTNLWIEVDDVRSFLMKEQSVSISHRQIRLFILNDALISIILSLSAAAHHHHHHHEGASMKSAHCSSEPRLTENDVSPGIRRRGSRRGQSMHYSHQRKSNAFLDVPDVSSQIPPREEGEDEDSYRLRSFSLTSKGQK
ncbi:Protein couch potato [Atta colombica]|uniref:Protein couch potato n=1 Tax=Atta colombica TaxID=520822 RepID=A0A195B2V2_9HYME|nr:Protein couch potato [Atta colombica]